MLQATAIRNLIILFFIVRVIRQIRHDYPKYKKYSSHLHDQNEKVFKHLPTFPAETHNNSFTF